MSASPRPPARRRPASALAPGAAAGVAATIPMSAWMWMAQQLGLMGQQPPERVTRWQMRRLHHRQSAHQEDRSSVLEHLAFGGSAGAAYGLLRTALPPPARGVAGGVAYGLAVWFSAYMGWLPALRILPRADRDRPGRAETMVTAHVVYGAVLGALLRGKLVRPAAGRR